MGWGKTHAETRRRGETDVPRVTSEKWEGGPVGGQSEGGEWEGMRMGGMERMAKAGSERNATLRLMMVQEKGTFPRERSIR